MQRTLESFELKSTNVQSVKCPLCLLNITEFELNERESHVENCLAELDITDKEPSSDSVKRETNQKESQNQKQKQKQKRNHKKKQKPVRFPPKFKILTFDLKYPKPLLIKVRDEDEDQDEEEDEQVVGDYNEMKFQVNVDGFNFTKHANIKHYFLSHFHSDHYIGLTKSWNKGDYIYTSHQTVNLSIWKFHLENVETIGLDFEKWYDIYKNKSDDNDVDEVVRVKIFDANHCPGGAIFLFEHILNDVCQKRILHTGDFRVSKKHIMHFKDLYIDQIYLDTTYLNPKYLFLEQSKLVQKTGEFIKRKLFKDGKLLVNKPSILNFFNKSDNNRWVLLIGSYSIGKENLYLHLSKILNSKVYISRPKYEMLCKCFEREIMEEYFSVDQSCLIHVVPIGKLQDPQFLNMHYRNRNIIKLKPTGWSFAQYLSNPDHQELIKKTNSGKILTQDEKKRYLDEIVFRKDQNEEMFEKNLEKMYQVSNSLNIPYSEHSNFKELSMFCAFVKWGEVIPTVMNNYGKYTKRKIDDAFDEDKLEEEEIQDQIQIEMEEVIEVTDDMKLEIDQEIKIEKDEMILNDYDPTINDNEHDAAEGEFERWFRIWHDYEVTMEQIVEYYG